MNRTKALMFHTGIGLLLLMASLLAVFTIWYPAPYFRLAGNMELVYVTAAICLVGGPLLTMAVFKPGKKGLKFDLWVIGFLQLAALVYTLQVLYSQKPQYMVFALDRFTLIPMGQVDPGSIGDPRFLVFPLRGPLELVATLPTDPDALQKFRNEFFGEGKPDLEWRPEFWSLYSEDYRQAVHAAGSLDRLAASGAVSDENMAAMLGSRKPDVPGLAFLPLIGRKQDFAVIIRTDNGDIVDAVPLSSWVQ
jgi:hypothetical protein